MSDKEPTPLELAKKELEKMEKKGWRFFKCKQCGNTFKIKWGVAVERCGGCLKKSAQSK